MNTLSFVCITLRASKLQARYRKHVITNSYGELFRQVMSQYLLHPQLSRLSTAPPEYTYATKSLVFEFRWPAT